MRFVCLQASDFDSEPIKIQHAFILPAHMPTKAAIGATFARSNRQEIQNFVTFESCRAVLK